MADKILATVGNIAITESEVNEFIAGLGQRAQAYSTPEGRKAVLNQIISNKLLLLDARRNLLEAEPEFKAQLAKLKDSLLASYAGERALASVTVTEDEARKYYEENKEQFMTGETVNASHILVDSEEKANEIYLEITSGKVSFEEAASLYSSCPSKASGGNLGEFGRGQMVGEFDAAVFAMEVGEITGTPVKTQFGYHLIKLIAKNEPKITPYADLRAEIMNALLSEKRRKAYETKINQLKIMYPVDMLGV